MQAINALCGAIVGIASVGSAFATDAALTGTFTGHGRQCDGRLRITAKTIEWRTPFASCSKRPYEILEDNLNDTKPSATFLLKGQTCDFGVIALRRSPEHPDRWIARGYRSLDDYKRDSADNLGCSLERLKK